MLTIFMDGWMSFSAIMPDKYPLLSNPNRISLVLSRSRSQGRNRGRKLSWALEPTLMSESDSWRTMAARGTE